ncbi:MAG: extracellular solute-binding protein, partial [Angelakisella sp.]
MMKKILSLTLVAMLAISCLAGCGGAAPSSPASTPAASSKAASSTPAPVAETVKMTVWGAQEDQELLTDLIEGFKKANPDKTYEITMGAVGEGEAKEKYLQDPTAAADVFAFANDQLFDLVNAGGLYEVTKNKDAIVAANNALSVDSATAQDGKLYAYPMTADNGYFMYYNKSVFTADDVKSFDGMLAAADKAGKKVFMDVSNGWYIASFFFGNGGKMGTGADGKAFCDFNNDKGVAAAEGIKAITAHKAFLTGDDNVLKGGFADGSVAAGISGTWNAGDIKTALGDNYGVCKLPTFTCGGAQVQMSSYAGTKLIGVNSQTKSPLDAMALAEWL